MNPTNDVVPSLWQPAVDGARADAVQFVLLRTSGQKLGPLIPHAEPLLAVGLLNSRDNVKSFMEALLANNRGPENTPISGPDELARIQRFLVEPHSTRYSTFQEGGGALLIVPLSEGDFDKALAMDDGGAVAIDRVILEICEPRLREPASIKHEGSLLP